MEKKRKRKPNKILSAKENQKLIDEESDDGTDEILEQCDSVPRRGKKRRNETSYPENFLLKDYLLLNAEKENINEPGENQILIEGPILDVTQKTEIPNDNLNSAGGCDEKCEVSTDEKLKEYPSKIDDVENENNSDKENNQNLIENLILSDAKQNDVPISKSSNSRGRKATVPKDLQLNEYRLKANDLLDKEKNVLAASAPIFEELWHKFNRSISKKAIQLNVKNYADEIFGKHVVNVKTANECQSEVSPHSDEEFASLASDGLTVSFNIDQKHMDKIKVIEGGGKRGAKTLKTGWSDALNDIIIEQTHIECVINFKNVTVVDDEFLAYAKCSECFGTINAQSFNNMTKLRVDINYGNGTHTHTKQRRLTVARAKSLIPALEKDTVFNVHSDLINEFDPNLEFLPSNYVSQKSLANIKHRYINNKPGSFNELREMKNGDYCDVIHIF